MDLASSPSGNPSRPGGFANNPRRYFNAAVYNYYPKAFSANLINDADPNRLAEYRARLTESVRRGDNLMVHADYWQANNPTVVQMYMDAGRTP